MAETSDTRFLNICRRHLDIFKAEANWNPSNSLLEIIKLEAQLDAAYPIANDVPARLAPQKIRINDRQASYAKINPMVRASRRYLKSSGATEAEIADAYTYINKILADRAAPKPKVNPDLPAAEAENSNSVSHQSYDSKLGNLIGYREFAASVSVYQPNEDAVKITTMDALIAECTAANNAISTGFVPLLSAWNLRDAKLYTDATSVFENFRDAKEYYKSLYEPNSPQYRAITAPSMALQRRNRS